MISHKNYLDAQKKLFCNKYFDTSIRSTKTGPGPTGKFYVQMNPFVKRNLPVQKNFRYDHPKYKNRKPDRKPDPGPTGNFYG